MKRSIYILFLFAMIAISLTVASCEQELDIKSDYAYSVTMQKYRNEIALGETLELEFFINPEGNYEPTEYYVSYFIRKGEGTVSDSDNHVLEKNTFYKVTPESFKLYYTAYEGSSHQLEVILKDSFGKEQELKIDLSTKN